MGQTRSMGFKVLVIDETLGNSRFAKLLLEGLEYVARAEIVTSPEHDLLDNFAPDILLLGSRWLDSARAYRKRFPAIFIVGRCPWYDELDCEFFPWGDELREPTLPLTSLIPRLNET